MVLLKPVDWEVQDGNMEWLGRIERKETKMKR